MSWTSNEKNRFTVVLTCDAGKDFNNKFYFKKKLLNISYF